MGEGAKAQGKAALTHKIAVVAALMMVLAAVVVVAKTADMAAAAANEERNAALAMAMDSIVAGPSMAVITTNERTM